MVANFSDYAQNRKAYIQEHTQPSPENQAISRQEQARDVIEFIESDRDRRPSDVSFVASMTGELDITVQARLQMQDDIYEAAISRLPEARLAQVAKSWGIPIDTAKSIAFDLVKQRLNVDPDELEFKAIVAEIKEYEKILDSGLRDLKLERLARKHKLSKPAMMNCYHKALINQAPFIAYNIDQLDDLAKQVRNWLVGGWIPQGVVLLLHALGGAGKSLLIYEMLECIVKGTPWNGYPVAQGPVLVLQSDEPIIVTRERMAIRNLTGAHPIRVVPGWQVEQIARLEAYLQEAHDAGDPIKVVMVDSVTSINRNTLISENDTEYARFMLQLNDLGDRFGCTCIVIHHSNSDGESRGTKALYNSASEVWGLNVADEQSGDRVLRVQKTRLGRAPGRYKFSFDEDEFTFTYLGKEGEEMGQEEVMHAEKRIELWLQEDGHRGIPYSTEELGQFLQINNHTIRKVIREMWAKGVVLRTKSGRAYLYHVGELGEPPTDRPNIELIAKKQGDQLGDHFAIPDTASDTAPTDQLIAKNTETKLLRMPKSGDQLISSPETHTTQEPPTDRPTDRELIAPLTIENPPIGDQFAIGDLVMPKTSATWYKSGSDKLPWRELRPTLSGKSSLQLSELHGDIFFELTDPAKILEINRDGSRCKIRNQKTGRTSTINTAGLTKL